VDREVAHRWLRAAAERGHGYGQMMLGRYLAQGAAGTYDPVEARLWLERAIAQGVEEAQEDLDALPTEEISPSRIPGATTNSEFRLTL
jgi:TPR repeat protein